MKTIMIKFIKKLSISLISIFIIFSAIFVNNGYCDDLSEFLKIKDLTGNSIVEYIFDINAANNVSIVSGSAIDGLEVSYVISEDQYVLPYFNIKVNKDVVLNDVLIECHGSLNFELDNNLTINSTVYNTPINKTPSVDTLFSDESYSESIPNVLNNACLYVDDCLSIEGDKKFEINFNVSDETSSIPSSNYLGVCVVCNCLNINRNLNVDGTSIPYTTFTINELRDNKYLGNEVNYFDVPLFINDTTKNSFVEVKYTNVNINSYMFGLYVIDYMTIYQYSKVNLFRKESNFNQYAGYVISSNNATLFNDNSYLKISEDQNITKSLSSDINYNIFGVDQGASNFAFTNSEVYIDLSKMNGVSFTDYYSHLNKLNNTDYDLTFDNSKATIYSPLYFDHENITFSNESNFYFCTDSSVFISYANDPNRDKTINIWLYNSGTGCFESKNGSWSDGFYFNTNSYINDATASYTDRSDFIEYDLNNSNNYKVVAFQKEITVGYSGSGEPITYKTFDLIPEPQHEDRNNDPFVGWYYLNDEGELVKYDFDTCARYDMELFPKYESDFIEKEVIENINLTEINYYCLDFGYDVNFDTEQYKSDYISSSRYAFKQGNCLYYSPENDDDVYCYPSGNVYDYNEPIGFNSDVQVYNIKIDISDEYINQYCFDNTTTVSYNGVQYNLLGNGDVVNQSTIVMNNNYLEGYYFNEDDKSIHLQLVAKVPNYSYVDEFNITHNDFDFDNLNIDVKVPSTFKINKTIIGLAKNNTLKYFIYKIDNTQIYTNSNFELIDVKDIKDIDTAVCLFITSPIEEGYLFNNSTSVKVNGKALEFGDKNTPLLSDEKSGNDISKISDVCIINKDSAGSLSVQLKFSLSSDPNNPSPSPYIIPKTGIR